MRSRMHAAATLATALAVSACGGVSPSGFAYVMPSPATATYETTDTTHMDIDTGGESMQATVAAASRMGARFQRGTDGLRVTLSVDDYDARMVGPMGPSVAADESQISGPLVLTLDRRGGVTVVAEPQVEGPARQYFGALSLAHTFFPRLPGRVEDVGAAWTDTIRYEGKQGDGDVSSESVLTYTVVGDTVVGGRPVARIDVRGLVEGHASGIIGGMDYGQDVHGTMSGWVLWDQRRGLMVESVTDTDGQGSMQVSAAPFPLGISMRQQVTIRLKTEM